MDVLTEIAEYNLALRSVDRVDEVVDPEVVLSLGTGVPPMRKVRNISMHALWRNICLIFHYIRWEYLLDK